MTDSGTPGACWCCGTSMADDPGYAYCRDCDRAKCLSGDPQCRPSHSDPEAE